MKRKASSNAGVVGGKIQTNETAALKPPADVNEWNSRFTELQQKQLKALTEDEAVKAHLSNNKLTTVFRTWRCAVNHSCA